MRGVEEEGEEGRRGGEGRRAGGLVAKVHHCAQLKQSLWLNPHLWGDQHIFWSQAAVCDALCMEVGQCLEQLAGQSGERSRTRRRQT